MKRFVCPACEQPAIDAVRKWTSTSFNPATCPRCRAAVYISPRQSSLWRSLEALLITLIAIRALIGFAWSLVAIGLAVIVLLEGLRLLLAPLVRLERAGFRAP